MDEQYMGVEGIPVEDVVFELDEGALTVSFTFVDESQTEEKGDLGRMAAALQPLLARHKATLLFIEGDDY